MLYDFLYSLHEEYSFFNVFKYVTFRTAVAMITALVLSFILGPGLIWYLKKKNFGERIREDAPDHHSVKAGTPTMGGLLILVATIIPALLWLDLSNTLVLASLLTLLLFGGIGVYDDVTKMMDGHGLPMRKHFLLP